MAYFFIQLSMGILSNVNTVFFCSQHPSFLYWLSFSYIMPLLHLLSCLVFILLHYAAFESSAQEVLIFFSLLVFFTYLLWIDIFLVFLYYFLNLDIYAYYICISFFIVLSCCLHLMFSSLYYVLSSSFNSLSSMSFLLLIMLLPSYTTVFALDFHNTLCSFWAQSLNPLGPFHV